MQSSGKKWRYRAAVLILFGLTGLLLLLGCSRRFCDLYTDSVYGVISDFWGKVTAPVPAALGELLMYLGAVLLLCSAVFFILLFILRKRQRWRHFCRSWFRGMLMLTAVILFLYAANWWVPFHSSVLGAGEQYEAASGAESFSDLLNLRNAVTEQLNAAAEQVNRDENNAILYPEQRETDLAVRTAMQNFSSEFPRLSGYYPPMKNALCSDVLDWMGVGGYTYPFTMELTGNQYVTKLYYPVLYAHESSHHQGYYKEHEANFLSYAALLASDDPLLQYAALIQMYSYLNRACRLASEAGTAEEQQRYADRLPPTELLWQDLEDAENEAAARYTAASHPLERWRHTAETAAETGWNTQAQLLGEYHYDNVTMLLLQYYKGKLY